MESFPEIFNFTFGSWECMGQLEWDGKQLIHKLMVAAEHGRPLSISDKSWGDFWHQVEMANV